MSSPVDHLVPRAGGNRQGAYPADRHRCGGPQAVDRAMALCRDGYGADRRQAEDFQPLSKPLRS
jgi:hypothetical protein